MSYTYLDDGFPEHEKVSLAGGDAGWLYVCGLCYVNRRLSGGRIPKPTVPQLSDRKRPMALAAKLVEVGLWEDGGDHFVIHDYATFNASAERKRAARIEKAKKAAGARWHSESDAPSMPQASAEHAPSNAQASENGCSPMPTHASGRARAGSPTPQRPNALDVELSEKERPVITGSLAPAKPKRRDRLFEAVAEAEGTNWTSGMTNRARQALNAAVGDLRAAGADPDDVPVRAERYRRRFPDAPLTANALAKHWPKLGADVVTDLPRHQRGVAEFLARTEGR